MKKEATTKNKGKGGDDDARDNQASFSSSKMILSSMENGSKLHGHYKSYMKDHGFTTTRRYVRKSSSMTLNEALCRR
jgi:hypothetical protein